MALKHGSLKNKRGQRHDKLFRLSLIKICAQLPLDKLVGVFYTEIRLSSLINQLLLRILHKVSATWKQLRVMLAGTGHHEEAFAAT